MTDSLDSVPHSAVKAPLGLTRPVDTLGRAVWLYFALLATASSKGVVLRTRANLAGTLAVSEPEVDEWLKRLIDAHLVTIQSPQPFLVLKIDSWPGRPDGHVSNTAAIAEQSSPAQEEVPSYSRSSAEAIALRNNSAGDRGPGEGGALRSEIRALLPEADSDELDRILAHYPTETIRKAIERVKRTPDRKIRKSRTALFRFLLTKLSENIDADSL